MILEALTGKALPYIAAGVGVVLLAMAGTIYWLMSDRARLNERVGKLDQANQQLAQTAHEQAAENAALQAEITKRDRVVQSAVRARQLAQSNAQSARKSLEEALADNACAHSRHPAAIADSLRSLTADHQDENRVSVSPGNAD